MSFEILYVIKTNAVKNEKTTTHFSFQQLYEIEQAMHVLDLSYLNEYCSSLPDEAFHLQISACYQKQAELT